MDEREICVILKKERDHLKILGKESSTELFEFFADSNLHLKNEALEKYTGKCIEYICDICKKAPRETFHLKLQGRINEILNAIYIQINGKLWEVMMSTDGHFFMMCDKMPFNAGLSADDQVATTFAFKLACFECMMKEFREDDFPLIIDFYHCFNQKEKDLMVNILSSAAKHMGMSVRCFSRGVIEAWINECHKSDIRECIYMTK